MLLAAVIAAPPLNWLARAKISNRSAALWARHSFMSMKEFFPFALARCHQRRRSGENQHKGPASRFGPVIKGFQSRRIILLESSLQLVNQRRTLLNEADLVTAQCAQFSGQRIQWRKGTPAMAVGAKRISQTPRVMKVILAASGSL